MPFPAQKGLGSPGGPRVVVGTRKQLAGARASGTLAQVAAMQASAAMTASGGSVPGDTNTSQATGMTPEQEKALAQAEAQAQADDAAAAETAKATATATAKKATAKKAAAKK